MPVSQVSGVVGSLWWGYHRAAAVRRWRVDRGDSGWSLTGTLGPVADTFALSQRPLVFEAAHARGVWRWPCTTLQITGASISAVLGPKEAK